MRPPGGLVELGAAGRAAWSDLVAAELKRLIEELTESRRKPRGLLREDEAPAGVRTIEWPAFPVRVAAKLGTAETMKALDRPLGKGPTGGRFGQEEYLEWRLLRRGGKTRGIEMTTEFREYWTVLAAHEPRRTLKLVGKLAGQERPVAATEVYGKGMADPLAPGVGPEQREAAFAATMLPDYDDLSRKVSPCNDGRKAFCCMVQKNNSLDALLALVLSAARPLIVEDEVTRQKRYPSGSEAIERLDAEAVDGRNSDPLIVERVVRFAGEGRGVGVDDPLGVYIRELQLHELEQPGGEDVPRSWLKLSRGAGATDSPDGRPRRQRLKLELPEDADFSFADLRVRRSGERLRFGGQLAELVELGAYIATGPVRKGKG